MRVLEIGSGETLFWTKVPEYATAKIVNASPDMYPLPYQDGEFDGVIGNNVLQTYSYWAEYDILKEWVRVLKMGGTLHVIVPSLEWCAREILSGKPSRALLVMLFGSQQDQHSWNNNGYTLRKLRVSLEKSGIAVSIARRGTLEIGIGDERIIVEQHYVAGVKDEWLLSGKDTQEDPISD